MGVQLCLTCLQDGDPFAQYPDDADVPEGESEVAFRIRAATEIKGIGNELYKKVSDGSLACSVRCYLASKAGTCSRLSCKRSVTQ